MSRDTSHDVPLPDWAWREAFYHESPAANRESTLAHGLDWTRMGAAPGLASGTNAPEEAGVYLASSVEEARWFAGFPRWPELVDIWEVRGEGCR